MRTGGAGRAAGAARTTGATATHASRRAVIAVATAAIAHRYAYCGGDGYASANRCKRTRSNTTGSRATGSSRACSCRSLSRGRYRCRLGKGLTDQAGHEDYCKQFLHVNSPV